MEHLLIGILYGIVVLVPILYFTVHLYTNFASPIMDKTTSTPKGRKKMIVNGLGLMVMFTLFAVALWFTSTDTFASVGDSLAGSQPHAKHWRNYRELG